MPRINRARVVNVRYDEGRKAYLDQIFDFRGENGIVLLENGGGKTLLVQLLLQVIIPNTRMNKRLFRELFSSGQTSHLMIEWLSDGPKTEYILTGLTAMLPRDSEVLSLFNFIHSYSEPDPFDLDSIPVIRDRRVTPRAEFRRLLRSSDRDVRIYDTREEYDRDLATYNIFRSEWDAIRRANDEEGRAEGFFDGATTVARLFRGILIPSVIDVLYPGQDRDEVARVFAELRDKLVNIPRYRDELDELERTRGLIEGIREEIAEYGRLSGLHAENLTGMGRLYRTLEDAVPPRERAIAALREQQEAAGRRRRELEFELECLDVDEARLRLEVLVSERGQLQSGMARVERERELVRGRRDLLEAGDLKRRALEKDGERAGARARLAVEEDRAENLAAELRSLRRTQLRLLPKEIERARGVAGGLQDRLDEATIGLEETRKERDRIRREIGHLQEERGALRERIARADRMAREIEQRLGWETMVNPGEALQERRTELGSVDEERDGRREATAAAREETGQLKEQLVEFRVETSETVSERERIDERLEAFERKRADLQAALLPHVDGERSLDDLHSLTLAAVLEGERKSLGRQLEEAAVRYHESRAGLSRMEAEEAYVPNGDMIAVRDALVEMGISPVFGGQLVRSQPLDEQEQLAVLHRHPLLPYGLVITADDLSILSADLDVLGELSLEAPVPLFTDRETLLFGGGGGGGLVSIGEGYAHLTPNRSFPLHVSEEELVRHRGGLERGARESRERMDVLRESIEGLGDVISRLHGFQDRYPPDHAGDLQREIARIAMQLGSLEERTRDAGSRIDELARIEREAGEELEDLDRRAAGLEGEIAGIEAYLPVRSERAESRERLKEVDDSLRTTDSELEDVQERERSLGESIRELGVELDGRREELAGLQNVLDDLRERDLGEGEPADGTYREIADRIGAVQQRLDGAGTAGLRELVRNLTEQIDGLHARMRDLDFDPEETVPRRVPRASLENLQRRIDDLDGDLGTMGERNNALSGDIQGVEGEIREKCRSIERQHGRRPPESITVRRVEEARLRLRERISDIEKRMAGLAEEVEAGTRLVEEWLEVARRARAVLQRERFEVSCEAGPLDRVPENPREYLDGLEDAKADLDRRLHDQRFRVSEAYGEISGDGGYRHEVTRDVFATVGQLPRKMLYDPGEMEPRFEEFFALLEQNRAVVEENLRILEEDRREVERKALREGERLLDELNQIQGYSRFRLRGRRTYTVRVDLRAPGGEERAHRMQRYVERSVNRLVEMEEPAVDAFVRDHFSPMALVDAVAPVDGYRVEVLKPQRQSERANYVPWESVPKWSGGEKFTAYFMMLVTLLSYLRAKRVPEYASGKVLIADNPFGRASSRHLLEVVFGLARETGTQMICLTALNERAIYDNFPIVYSLVLRRTQGRQYVQVNRDDSVLPTGSAVISSAQYGIFDERTDADE